MLKRRYILFQVGLVVMFVVLAAQLYHMQILEGSTYDAQSKGNRERTISIKADRGIIYDRSGVRLVANDPSYSVSITPADFPDDSSASGKAQRDSIFAPLQNILGAHDVIAVMPKELPQAKIGEVANR